MGFIDAAASEEKSSHASKSSAGAREFLPEKFERKTCQLGGRFCFFDFPAQLDGFRQHSKNLCMAKTSRPFRLGAKRKNRPVGRFSRIFFSWDCIDP